MRELKETIQNLEDNEIKIGWMAGALRMKWIELQADQTQTDIGVTFDAIFENHRN